MSHVPTGWPTVVPRIVVPDPAALVAFVKRVFAATGDYHESRPTELWIEGSVLMISGDAEREAETGFLYVYVPDADGVHQRAVAAGATSVEAPTDTHYGDRRAIVRDAWGNTWQIATHGGRFTPDVER